MRYYVRILYSQSIAVISVIPIPPWDYKIPSDVVPENEQSGPWWSTYLWLYLWLYDGIVEH